MPSAIQALIKTQYQTLLLAQPGLDQALRHYQWSGGPSETWTATGLYIHLKKNNRLVLEALYLKQHDGCVVRVYTERPLKFFYARKVQEHIEACGELIREASQQFQLRFPKKLLPAAQFDPPRSLGHVARVLLPLPPPLSSCEVPD